MNNELDELEKIRFYLSPVLGLLERTVSVLEEPIRELKTNGEAPNETTYESLQEEIENIINAAVHMAKSLKIIAENLSLPEKSDIPGPARQHRLDITEIEKHEIVDMTLVSAIEILRSHFDTVSDLALDITETCQEYQETN